MVVDEPSKGRQEAAIGGRRADRGSDSGTSGRDAGRDRPGADRGSQRRAAPGGAASVARAAATGRAPGRVRCPPTSPRTAVPGALRTRRRWRIRSTARHPRRTPSHSTPGRQYPGRPYGPHDGSDLIADLEARNLIHDSTDRDSLRDAVAAGPVAIYYGCDPTADSLHVGNLIGLDHAAPVPGCRPPTDRTGRRGDRHGRRSERPVRRAQSARRRHARTTTWQRSRRSSAGSSTSEPGRGELVDNRDWTQPITVLEFLRDVGKHVTVNQMLARESIKLRVNSEHGISFTEFSYMLLQANDYLWLHDNLGCTIQIGGSDQWGNIIAGVDLIRRKRGEHVHAFSWPLLTASDGSQARQDHRCPGVARPGEDQPLPVPPALDADSRRRGRRAVAHVLAPTGRADPSRSWPSTPRRRTCGSPSGRSPTR